MEGMVMSRKFWILSFVLFTTLASFAQEDGEDGSSDAPEGPPVRRSAPLLPTWQLTLKDSRYLNQMVQKNAWFQEFRQTPLYMGLMQKLSPVLFSMADEYGPSAQSWKGRLLDYAYEKIMAGQPVVVSYYNRPSLVSPVVISLFDLPSANSKIAEGLIKVFRSAEDKEMELEGAVKIKVTPLLIRNQKFAVFLKDKCLVISRDPELVSLNALGCKDLKAPAADGVFQLRISQQFPALNGLREKFLATDDILQMNFKWNSSLYKLEPDAAQVQLKGLSPFQKGKLSAAVVKGLPATSFFYATATLPSLGSVDGEGVAKYFKEDKKTLLKRKPTSVTLFYTPFIEYSEVEEEKNKVKGKKEITEWKMGTGLLLHYPSASTKTLEDLSQLMKGQKAGEIFMRPVCKDLIVLSNQKNMIRLVDEVCGKKRPSFAELNEKWGQQLTKKDISAAFYFSSGKLMSRYMQMGWEKNKNKAGELPIEIKQSQKLVESLPEYLFSGTTDKNLLLMKSTL